MNNPRLTGNVFWKLRTTHGRHKLFADGPLLRDEAERYFDWIDRHPRHNIELVKHLGTWSEAEVPLKRAYTVSGLCAYLNVSGAYFRTAKGDLRQKIEEGKATDIEVELLETIEWIETVILTEQVDGALVGHYKENLVSRLNGLSDNVNNHASGDTVLRVTVRDDATAKNMEALNDLL